MPARVLFLDFEKEVAAPAIERLGGKLLLETRGENALLCYEVTMLGAMLTEDEAPLRAALRKGLEFARDAYINNPLVRRISSLELLESGRFSESELQLLRLMINLPYHDFLISSGGQATTGEWYVNIREEIYELRTVTKWDWYIDRALLTKYDPRFPVSESGRVELNNRGIDLLESVGQIDATDTPQTDVAELTFDFVENSALKQVLQSDWLEANRVASLNACKSCILLCGGIIEGLLLLLVLRIPKEDLEISIRELKFNSKDPARLGSAELQELCKKHGLLGRGHSDLSNFVRLYRNFVHPGLQAKESAIIRKPDVRIALAAVESIYHFVSEKRSLES